MNKLFHNKLFLGVSIIVLGLIASGIAVFANPLEVLSAELLPGTVNTPPTAPAPLSPANGETINGLYTRLTYKESTDVDWDGLYYQVYLSTDASNLSQSSPLMGSLLSGDIYYSQTQKLDIATTYYWRVDVTESRDFNNLTTVSSDIFSFRTPEQYTFSCDNVTSVPKSECEALISFYDSLDGPNWDPTQGWKLNDDPCTWGWITCVNGHVAKLYTNIVSGWGCQGEDCIVDVFPGRLTGKLPEDINKLTELNHLDLSFNNISGSIPTQLFDLVEIDYIDLSNNKLSGQIPSQIGNLTNLVNLNLGNNHLTGGIPDEMKNLNKLEEIILGYNNLEGNVPPFIGQQNNLRLLDLSSNSFTGQLNFLCGLKEQSPKILNRLELSSNKFVGEIPNCVEELTGLMDDYGIKINNNMLYTNDQDLKTFLTLKSRYWANSQVLPPQNIQIQRSSTGALLSWMPIQYYGSLSANTIIGPHYEVRYSEQEGGPYNNLGCKTQSITYISCIVDGLDKSKAYYFVVGTFVQYEGHGYGNTLWNPGQEIVVPALNHRPTNITLSGINIEENRPIGTQVGIFTTEDIDTADSFTYRLVEGDGATDNVKFSIDGKFLLTSSVFDYEAKNTYSIRVESQDLGGLNVEEVFEIRVLNINESPVITSSPITQVFMENEYKYQVVANDVDNDPLVYTLTTSPLGMSIGNNGLITWTPKTTQIGDSTVTIEASDGQLKATQTYTINVKYSPDDFLNSLDDKFTSISNWKQDSTAGFSVSLENEALKVQTNLNNNCKKQLDYSKWINVTVGKKYYFAANLKTINADAPSVLLNLYDVNFKLLGTAKTITGTAGKSDWKEYRTNYAIPAKFNNVDVKYAKITLKAGDINSASYWSLNNKVSEALTYFDDVYFSTNGRPYSTPTFSPATINYGKTVTLSAGTVTDPDGNKAFTYKWEQVEGPTLTIKNSTKATASFVAPKSTKTSYTVKIRLLVSDGQTTSVAKILLINIRK